MRQVVLDTETTGLEPNMGHRIIEIGAVEMVNRKLTGRHFHEYINPERAIDDGALEVHGISEQFLADKPKFAEVADQFMQFIEGAEVVIHNAGFDVSFLDYELGLLQNNAQRVESVCSVVDSLLLARQKHPGQRNNLDALCRRYGVDNSQRDLHGALLDAEILADVYLLMTGGQTNLFAAGSRDEEQSKAQAQSDLSALDLALVPASANELLKHDEYLEEIAKATDGPSLWRQVEAG